MSKTRAKQETLFTKSFVLMWLCRFGSSCIFMTLTATVASFCFVRYGVDEATAGFAVGIFIIFGLISRYFAGRYADVVGRRKTLIASTIAYFATSALYMIDMPFFLFVVLRAAQGFAMGIYSNITNVICATIVPKNRIGEGLNTMTLSGTLGMALGPFIGILIMQNVSYFAMFVFCTFCIGISLVTAPFIEFSEPEITGEERERVLHEFHLSDAFEASVIPISIIIALFSIINAFSNSFITTYAGTIDAAKLASWVFIVNAVVQFAAKPYIGRVFDTRGADVAMTPSFISFTLAFGFFALAIFNKWLLLVATAFIAFGFGNIMGIGNAICVSNMPDKRLGPAIATFYALVDGGTGIGPMIFGALIVPMGGYSPVYALCGVLTIFISMYYYYVSRKMQRAKAARNASEQAAADAQGEQGAQVAQGAQDE